MKKVLIIVGDASETLDTLYPFYRLQEGGFEPVVAAPEKRTYQMVMHEVKPGWTITKEWEGYTIEAKIAFKDIVESEYAGIFFSGGRAPEYIREDPDLIRITQYFFDNDLPGRKLESTHLPILGPRASTRKSNSGSQFTSYLELEGTDEFTARLNHFEFFDACILNNRSIARLTAYGQRLLNK